MLPNDCNFKTGWSWCCSHQNSWAGCSSWRTCCSVSWSARPWNWKVPVLFQTMYYPSRRWSCFWFQTSWGWKAQDTVVCMQRKTCCTCQRGKFEIIPLPLMFKCCLSFSSLNEMHAYTETLFSCWVTIYVGYRFHLLEPHWTMMIFLFWIPNQKFSNLMVPIHQFKKGLKLWKLYSILRIPTMTENVM